MWRGHVGRGLAHDEAKSWPPVEGLAASFGREKQGAADLPHMIDAGNSVNVLE